VGDATSELRQLPRVDEILAHPRMSSLESDVPRTLARQAAREAIEEARARIITGAVADVTPDRIAARAAELLQRKAARSLRRAINATGVILHTGLGRAPLSESAQQALREVAAGYCNVQVDLETGGRLQREAHIRWLFQEITGAEAVLVVNNNAAATMLVLNTLAAGREVIVSRGEMVEIGGAFRMPDIMRLAGCRLVEVGCTNRTHLRDYEAAIGPATALILSVHQSNYRIEGFASQVPVGELVALAHARGLPCAHDLGSGALVDLRQYGLPHEPSVPESLAAGADVVFFSGDKLLGGPQCGIIVGKPDPVQAMRQNPFYRTFRVDKLTLVALEATLRLFLDPETLPQRHRLMSVLTCSLDAIRQRADALVGTLNQRCGAWLAADTADSVSEVGGGSLAAHTLPTVVARLRSERFPAEEIARRLRLNEAPVFARVREDAVLLDPRTMLPDEDAIVLKALERIASPDAEGEACPSSDT
jgi:L-seryl-tRNA(Ser) seleniumtransferase